MPDAEKDADALRAVIFRMAEDITRIKRVCIQEHPPKMGSPDRDWPAGTETRHGDGTLCVLLNDGDYAHVIPPAVHDHPPYRPVCSERRLLDGQLRGACLNDDGTSAASDDLRDKLLSLLARHAAAGTPAPVVIRRIQDVIER